jgi:VIT1/CCC1 family predicted Fe2+/Mn2+ transporter
MSASETYPMKTLLRNIAAVLVGLIAGSILNMALVVAGPQVIPPPPGVDVSNAASIKASIHLYAAKHFLFPFLAHALGAFTGALVAFVVAGSHRSVFAYVIGVLFLAGGIAACFMIPAPTWFIVVDLVVAYLPMAWLATLLGRRCTGNPPSSTSP